MSNSKITTYNKVQDHCRHQVSFYIIISLDLNKDAKARSKTRVKYNDKVYFRKLLEHNIFNLN